MRKILLYSILLSLFAGVSLKAQTDTLKSMVSVVQKPQLKEKEKDALKFNLNESGSHYFQVTFLNQAWFRFNNSNPGTLVDGEAKSNTFDIGLRRTRIQMYGQITDKVFLYFQFGQNNFNAQNNYSTTNPSNRKNSPFFHDAVVEYKVSKANQLKLGGGLTIVNGLSRFSQPSIATIMTMDVPVFAQATVDQTDEFSRKLSVYARGQIWKLDYRVALSDPFPVNTSSNSLTAPATKPTSAVASFAQKGHTHQIQAYVMYQFFDHENHTTPGYMTGTYLGKKKIFNIAAGLITQKKAMWYVDSTQTDNTGYSDMTLWSVESFLDLPVNKEQNTAVSAYAGYFNLNYGQNYLRYNGIMNPATSSSNPSTVISGLPGAYGNGFPMFGTGNVFYSQVGYLLPKSILGENGGQLMPYAQWMHGKYDRLQGNSMDVFNAGMNWLIKGHNAKLTLDYQNRPTYKQTGTQIQTDVRRGCFTLQYQIYI